MRLARLSVPHMRARGWGRTGVIVDAIEGNPRARYRVGFDARALGLTENLVPTFVRDRIARITLGL